MFRFLNSRVLAVGSATGLLRFGWSFAGDEEMKLEETSHPSTIAKITLNASKKQHHLLDTKLLSIKPLYNTLFGDDFHAKQANDLHKEPTMLFGDDFHAKQSNDFHKEPTMLATSPSSEPSVIERLVSFGLAVGIVYGFYRLCNLPSEIQDRLIQQLHSMFGTPEYQAALKDIYDDEDEETFKSMMANKDIQKNIVEMWMFHWSLCGSYFTLDQRYIIDKDGNNVDNPERKEGGPFLRVSDLLIHNIGRYEGDTYLGNWSRALEDFLTNHANITNDRITFYEWIIFVF